MERMEMHIISEQPVPLPDCPKREWIFLKIDLFFRLMTTVSHPPTKNNWEHQTSISCHLPMHARWILLCALTAICSLGSVSPGLHHCRDLFFSRVQDFASILVEFHNVPVVPFLQTVSVPMAGSPTPQFIAWSPSLVSSKTWWQHSSPLVKPLDRTGSRIAMWIPQSLQASRSNQETWPSEPHHLIRL